MSETNPPPEELRTVIEAMRGDRLSDDRVARLAARLAPMMGPPGGGGSGAGGADGAGASSAGVSRAAVGGKVVVASVLGLGALIGALWLFSVRRSETPTAAIPATATTSASASVSEVPVPGSSASDSATLSVAAPTASSSSKPHVMVKPQPASDPVAEEEILGRARAALAGNPGQALAHTEQHAAKFPSGMLTQEREQIAIGALLGLGRRPEAVARARRFATAWPRSPYVVRLRTLGLLE